MACGHTVHHGCKDSAADCAFPFLSPMRLCRSQLFDLVSGREGNAHTPLMIRYPPEGPREVSLKLCMYSLYLNLWAHNDTSWVDPRRQLPEAAGFAHLFVSLGFFFPAGLCGEIPIGKQPERGVVIKHSFKHKACVSIYNFQN